MELFLFCADSKLSVFHIQHNGISGMYITGKDLLGCQCLHIILEITFQRTRTVNRIITIVHYHLFGSICKLQGKFLVSQTVTEFLYHQINDLANVILGQWLEHDDLIQTVQKLRTEMSTEISHNLLLCFRFDISFLVDTVKKIRRTNVGSHDQNGILEVNSTSLRICDTSIIQYLQKHIEYIRVSLLDLIEKNNTVRFSSNSLCQLTAFLISDISWRRSDQTGHGIFLHVLTHIDTYHILLIIKQCGSQSFGKLCFTNTGWSKEQEGTDGLGRIFDSCFGTEDRICYKSYTFILSYYTFMKLIFKTEKFGSLTFRQLGYRNTGPSGNDTGDLIICNSLMYQASVTLFNLFLLNLQLLLKLRQLAVLQLCCFLQIVVLFRLLDLFIDILDLLT